MYIKTMRNNFCRNFPFLISCAANVVLCISKTIPIDYCLALVSLSIFVFSIFSEKHVSEYRMLVVDSSISAVATLVQFLLLIRFCNMFHVGELTEKIREYAINPDVLFFAVGCILCVVGRFSLQVILIWLRNALLPFRTILCSMKYQFVIISIIYIFGVSAIVRANYYYVDDMGRTLLGYQLTGDFSRYLSSVIAVFLHGNTWLTDISPLTQWLAVLIMAFASVLLIYIIAENTQHSAWSLAAVIPMGLCPYFLECYSYKFDAPYMALSVLAAIAPLVYRHYHPVKFSIASAVGTLIVCLTYQASSGILPMLVVLLSFIMWTQCVEIKKIMQFVASSATGYVMGMLIFRYILMVPVAEENYVSASVSLNNLSGNLKQYGMLISTQFNHLWLYLIGVIVLSFIYLVAKNTKKQKVTTLIAVIITLVIMVVLSFGVYVMLTKPIFAPRGMYGIGIFIAALCVYVVERINMAKAAVAILGWVFFVFSFTYGNALSIQKEYTDFRTEQVLTDLSSIESLADREEISIQIKGTIGPAAAIENMIAEYGILEKMVTVQFCDSAWPWGDYKLLHYYKVDFLKKESTLDLVSFDLPIIKDTIYHTINGNDEYILVVLK